MADELTRGALEGLARLRRKGLVSDHHSPENTAGCRCSECWGLALSPTRLRVVTMGPPADPQCDGGMVCSCVACVEERAARKAALPVKQPWDVRPLRRAA